MRNASLAAAFAIVILANAIALIHGASNRAGKPSAEVTLTNRELVYQARGPSDEDSGVTLDLQWTTANTNPGSYGYRVPMWLDPQKLQRLGFDCSVHPDAANAVRFYQVQRPRRAFIALEYDGQAWRNWVESRRPISVDQMSHLVAIDADLDADAIRLRHPDSSQVLIVPGVIAIWLNPFPYPRTTDNPPRIEGRIDQIASNIHVSRPLSDLFENRRRQGNGALASPYTVRLRYGRLLEPWVTDVKFGQ